MLQNMCNVWGGGPGSSFSSGHAMPSGPPLLLTDGTCMVYTKRSQGEAPLPLESPLQWTRTSPQQYVPVA